MKIQTKLNKVQQSRQCSIFEFKLKKKGKYNEYKHVSLQTGKK